MWYRLFVFIIFLLFLPIHVFLACLVLLTSGLPVYYRQKRTGQNGKPFFLWKFRTMVVNASALQREYAKLNEADGPVFKIHNDPRFTPLGKFLAHTGLDELPQLVNVIRGEMALIGPRPLPVGEAKKLTSWQKKRESILPGIISPWILEGYHSQTFDAWMKSDIDYSKKKSFKTDSKIFFQTIKFMINLFILETRDKSILS
ncbi:hypothetical protein A2Z00_05295 [Candidatus Gottesmanbacteria bacterium RBG_13_45_10]|uniref:Bacterial sugar transferase domain-containing protein n=1 Tax=Candidatus Gottesmanbacteria bacterium RBG_13_45_10 TaxID=1798370 RepID=A0A1F5ZHG9_9BACT|nr:MAG: hypothetical protein A2Z00_05295 [Candidatus Gottesmanbacteria bacterium RBG_13_45_10]